jgi:hypothetical protein
MARSVLAKCLLVALVNTLAAYALEPVNLAIDLSASAGRRIANKFGDVNLWSIEDPSLTEADAYPANYFKRNFPFMERIQLMAATGGGEGRDLFKNPADRTTLTDYDFSRLIKACETIVAKGLRPMIKTGWVPLKLSVAPRLGDFHANVQPPSDYPAYYAYIRAMAEALKTRFGIEQVKTWSWGVGVEYENRQWFEAADGKPESTKLAYIKLYDYTVSALEDALGAENVTVGAHSMSVIPGFWDECDFIEHCAKGQNSRTGKQGTKLDYLAVSFYTDAPGFDTQRFLKTVETVRQKAVQVGLNHLKYGVDEGRVLNGWDGRYLLRHETQHPVQAVSDAKLFHVMVEHDVDYLSTWCLKTKVLFGGIAVVSANLRNLAFRMAGSTLLRTALSGKPADAADEVNGLAGFDAAQKTLRVMVYNYNSRQDAKTSEDISLRVAHVRPSAKDGVMVRTWRLDADNGNWWKLWQADITDRKLPASAFHNSLWTVWLPGNLTNPADRAFWNSREAEYGKAGELRYTDERKTVDPDGQLTLQTRLAPQAVVLFEVFPVEAQTAEHKPR